MRNRASFLTLATAASLTLAALTAAAQPPDEVAEETARQARSAAAAGDKARLHGLALHQFESEDFAHALESLQALIDLCPGSLAVANNLAVARAASGDYEQALIELERLSARVAAADDRRAKTIRGNRLAVAQVLGFWNDETPPSAPDVADLALMDPTAPCLPASEEPRMADAGETAPAGQPGPAEAPPEGAGPAEEVDGDEEAATQGEADSVEAAILEAIGTWADAWQGQRVDDYLDAYSDRFEPADGGSRADWEKLRRERIGAPTSIVLILGDEAEQGVDEVMQVSDNVVRARFSQTYRSNTFSDTVNKTLLFVLEDDGWKIISESAVPIVE